jgi:hypothetical protein
MQRCESAARPNNSEARLWCARERLLYTRYHRNLDSLVMGGMGFSGKGFIQVQVQLQHVYPRLA